MSIIYAVYYPNTDGSRQEPNFPAANQNPAAVRYPFDHPTRGLLNVDAGGGAPSQAEIDAHMGIDAAGLAKTQRAAQDATDLATCAQDAQVTAFLNMSPADLEAWVAVNITAGPITLAQLKANAGTAITVLGKLALTAARGRKFRNT